MNGAWGVAIDDLIRFFPYHYHDSSPLRWVLQDCSSSWCGCFVEERAVFERPGVRPQRAVRQGRSLCTVVTFCALTGCTGGAPLDAASRSPTPASSQSLDGLVLVDASFATEVHDRQPARISQSISSEERPLSFWMELRCTGPCRQRLTEDGVVVSLDWYKEEEGRLLKQGSIPLSVKGVRWRTWGSKRVSPGKWVAVVRTGDSSWLCLSQQCYFSIEVKP
jgi:hypothetical protein